MSYPLSRGEIIQIENCPDPQGNNPDLRRFGVMKILNADEFVGVGISGIFTSTNPMHVQQHPTPKNKLTKLSAAICDTWVKVIQIKEITNRNAGYCHPPTWMLKITNAIAFNPIMKSIEEEFSKPKGPSLEQTKT